MDYRNRYRRGGIVGLRNGGRGPQEGFSNPFGGIADWWRRQSNRPLSQVGPEEQMLRENAAKQKLRKSRGQLTEDQYQSAMNDLIAGNESHILDLSDPNAPRERRGYTGPRSQEEQRAAMLAEEGCSR